MSEEYNYPDCPDFFTLRDRVRAKPAMYFGNVGSRALEHILHELVSNSIDEFLAGRASEIRVRVADGIIELGDDGGGLPFRIPPLGLGERTDVSSLTRPHQTGSADNHAPHVHLHEASGVGLAAVNAASAHLSIRAWRKGYRWEREFQFGVPVGEARLVPDASGRGTIIALKPDPAIFGDAAPHHGAMRARLFEAVHLFPGLSIQFQTETFHAPNGLEDLAWIECHNPTPEMSGWAERPAFRFQQKVEDITLTVAALGDTTSTPSWRSWVNGRRTVEHGTHRQGFANALRRVNWKPSVVMVHVVMHNPKYAGPVKDRLEVPQIRQVVTSGTLPALKSYCRDQELGMYRRNAG